MSETPSDGVEADLEYITKTYGGTLAQKAENLSKAEKAKARQVDQEDQNRQDNS